MDGKNRLSRTLRLASRRVRFSGVGTQGTPGKRDGETLFSTHGGPRALASEFRGLTLTGRLSGRPVLVCARVAERARRWQRRSPCDVSLPRDTGLSPHGYVRAHASDPGRCRVAPSRSSRERQPSRGQELTVAFARGAGHGPKHCCTKAPWHGGCVAEGWAMGFPEPVRLDPNRPITGRPARRHRRQRAGRRWR